MLWKSWGQVLFLKYHLIAFTTFFNFVSDNNSSSNKPKMQLKASKTQPPLGALITIEAVKEKLPVDIKWDKETSIDIGDGVVLTTNTSIARLV